MANRLEKMVKSFAIEGFQVFTTVCSGMWHPCQQVTSLSTSDIPDNKNNQVFADETSFLIWSKNVKLKYAKIQLQWNWNNQDMA